MTISQKICGESAWYMMNITIVFAFVVTLAVCVLAWKLLFSTRKPSSRAVTSSSGTKSVRELPGPAASDPVAGNLLDIGAAGSLHEYLVKLHNTHGPVVSFWWTNFRVVSLGGVEQWKSISRLFDRPVPLFSLFMPLIGEESLQYANGDDGRGRRKAYVEPTFTRESLAGMFGDFQRIGETLVTRWLSEGIGSSEHNPIHVHEEMMGASVESICVTVLGTGISPADVAVSAPVCVYIGHDVLLLLL